MPSLEPGKLYVPATTAEIRDDLLTDIRLEARKYAATEPAVQPGTDNWALATAVANAAYLQYGNIELAQQSITPLNATGAELERWRLAVGLPVVEPSPSSGKIVLDVVGSSTMPNGTQFVLPNGLRGKVVGTWVGVVAGSEVDAVAIDTGTATNLEAGKVVRFANPPLNVRTEAKVSASSPLTGGKDAEDDERKRTRIMNRLGNRPAGGSWADAREIALNALASVQDCYVYPALGGPGSLKIVPVRDYDAAAQQYTRTLDAAAVDIVRAAIYREFPSPVEVKVQAAAGSNLDVAMELTLPESALAGGNGTGWVDTTPWPDLAGADTRVEITGIASANVIDVNAATAVSPIAGVTHIAWWSSVDRKFRQFLVTGKSGAASAWEITLDAALADSTGAAPALGDYICPAMVNADAYGASHLAIVRSLGPAENTTDGYRLPRAKRHPYVSNESSSDYGMAQVAKMQARHPEITDFDVTYPVSLPVTPAVPASVETAPNILVARHFGIYQK